MTSQSTKAADGWLEIVGLHKRFGQLEVLKGVSLTVQPGTTTAVVGPSGSGKTTLLRLIAGFERAAGGSIRLGGRLLTGDGVWVPAHRRNVGYVAQEGALFPHLTVGQNIAFGLHTSAVPGRRRANRKRVEQLLEMVALDGALADRRPHQISGGQQQRVALARALAREPQLMLLDESFSALDAGLRVATRRAVKNLLANANITTVLVTHDQSEALSFADQVAVMRDGVLSQVAPPLDIYTHPTDQATAEFLGDAVVLPGWVETDSLTATCSLGVVPLAPTAYRGPVNLMLRPEQLRLDTDGPIRGIVVDSDYFGPASTVRLRLLAGHQQRREHPAHTGQQGMKGMDGMEGMEDLDDLDDVVAIRHSNAHIAATGTELRLRIEGTAIAFPRP
jgi:iron(III) transport system ATP-binding protein